MANEKHDPWALLREATAYLDDVVRSAPDAIAAARGMR